jgi:hypothetical protein
MGSAVDRPETDSTKAMIKRVACESDRRAPDSGTAGAHVREVRTDDLPTIWNFCAQSYDVFQGVSYEEFEDVWKHRWTENPAASTGQPLGWTLQTSEGQVVGFAGIVPLRLKIGRRSLTAFCGANWCVKPEYRRHSLAIFRKYTELAARHVVVSTGVLPAAAAVHARAMQPMPVEGADKALWWIIDPKRFLAWKVAKLGASSRLWTAIGAIPRLSVLGGIWPIALGMYTDPKRRLLPWLSAANIAFDCPPLPVGRITWFTAEFDQFWSEQRERYDVTVERYSNFLNWRHMLLPKIVGECAAFACRDGGRLLGYIVLQTAGYRGRLPGCFTVTDLFYPAEREDVLANLMNAAFRFALENGGTVLKLSGFQPAVYAAMASQRPHVLAPDTLHVLGRGTMGQRLLRVVGLSREPRLADRQWSPGSYWYMVPSADLAETCRSGSWWPSGIDGTSNL